MVKPINEIQDELIDEFSLFDDSEEKYQYIIDLGNKLKPFNDQYKTPENEIKGCQSKVWLHSILEGDKVIFEADSDGKIAKGVISMLVRILSGQQPDEIVKRELYFIDKVGLKTLLSMNRANGLASMVKEMKLRALAYQTKIENKQNG